MHGSQDIVQMIRRQQPETDRDRLLFYSFLVPLDCGISISLLQIRYFDVFFSFCFTALRSLKVVKCIYLLDIFFAYSY
jgi:hypothetical protein